MKPFGLKLGASGAAAALLSVVIVGCSEPNNTMEVLPPGAQRKPNLEGLPEANVVGEQGANVGNYGASKEQAEPPEVLAAEAKPEEPLPAKPVGEQVTTKTGLKYQIYKEGTGAVAVPDSTAYVHYTGKFPDGNSFDSSRPRNKAYPVVIGKSQVIQGWHEGINGMKVGERRVLTIPPSLAYGAEGQPPQIPPNATLVFDIELLGVTPPAAAVAPTPTPAPGSVPTPAASDAGSNADAKSAPSAAAPEKK